jgi:nitroimidazol reductase NimA-like FMN-containing flavoprotein (pyridoxamine 5'-phosphate oxidase superfamily)
MSVDELQALGMERMTDAEIGRFLSSQGVGVLGLSADEGPYMLPMSFGFDGEESLYFTYLVGEQSRKRELSERAGTAKFLVYKATSRFNWQSVVLTGSLSTVPESEWDDVDESMANAWHPDLFESAELSGGVAVYRFDIEERVGYKQTGLPPGFEPA